MHDWPGDMEMRVVCHGLACDRRHKPFSYVHSASEAAQTINDQYLAVAAKIRVDQFEANDRSHEQRRIDPAGKQAIDNRWAGILRPDGIDQHPHLDPALMRIDQRLRDIAADLVIVETKSLSAASATDRLLWRAGHRPVPVSKFATGLAALNPDLPRNRWARILRGPFAARNLELAAAA